MYSRIINGQEYTFGVSGKLIMNVLVMYDRQTGSLWSQLLGVAVDGEMRGIPLEYLPSWQTTWEEWKTRYPDTLALRKGYSGDRDPYVSYYASSSAGAIGRSSFVIEEDLYAKEFVIGIAVNDEAVAYPFSALNQQPIINDEIGGKPVLVVFDKDSAAGAIFERTHAGDTLVFSSIDGLTLTDDLTGSTWDGLTGSAIDGPLAGTSLTRLKSTTIFWFGWADFFPDTRIYQVGD